MTEKKRYLPILYCGTNMIIFLLKLYRIILSQEQSLIPHPAKVCLIPCDFPLLCVYIYNIYIYYIYTPHGSYEVGYTIHISEFSGTAMAKFERVVHAHPDCFFLAGGKVMMFPAGTKRCTFYFGMLPLNVHILEFRCSIWG